MPTFDPAVSGANPRRFLTMVQVAEELNVSRSQVYALVRDRSVMVVKIGGRGQWRVERAELERYINGLYEAARRDPVPGEGESGAVAVAPAEDAGAPAGRVRYGVFLRPDPVTCAAVTAVTGQVRAQFGVVSAGAFPPHATLAGSLPVAGPVAGLVAAVDGALEGVAAFQVHNGGVQRLGDVLVYDIHSLPRGPNRELVRLAAAVDAAVRPVLGPAPVGQLPADVHDPGRWRGHVSLAAHDPELLAEVETYVRGLRVAVPDRFTADTVDLYRFEDPGWSGPWWQTMRWEFVRSWRLPPAAR